MTHDWIDIGANALVVIAIIFLLLKTRKKTVKISQDIRQGETSRTLTVEADNPEDAAKALRLLIDPPAA